MFLDTICRRNRFLMEGAIALRRQAVRANARHLRAAGDRHGLSVLSHGQADRARGTDRAGMRTGNIGHLVQISQADAAALEPECRTVIGDEKAAEAVAVARRGRTQVLPACTHAPGDLFSKSQRLDAAGRRDLRVNAPGANSAVMFEALAAAGATQVEPGHRLTGTTALRACEDLPELPVGRSVRTG